MRDAKGHFNDVSAEAIERFSQGEALVVTVFKAVGQQIVVHVRAQKDTIGFI